MAELTNDDIPRGIYFGGRQVEIPRGINLAGEIFHVEYYLYYSAVNKTNFGIFRRDFHVAKRGLTGCLIVRRSCRVHTPTEVEVWQALNQGPLGRQATEHPTLAL